jgi:2-polyprenyl-3-methyl-5-hydroxy-6-metoxy-1,4-benzoquinol methylase
MIKKSTEFSYKEIDLEGLETLKVIADAEKFNNWTFEVISPFCNGKILEIGSGIGNISSRFIQNNFNIWLSDIRYNYRSFLNQKFSNEISKEKILDLDLVHPQFESIYATLIGTFDTVFALNVIEHIEDHEKAINNCRSLLRPGGKLIILVPAYKNLYNSFDKELMHYRRYNSNLLVSLFQAQNLEIIDSFYFNAGGIPGWFVSGFIQKNKTIPASQMKIYDALVPVFKIIDKLLFRRIGLSVICVGKKPL